MPIPGMQQPPMGLIALLQAAAQGVPEAVQTLEQLGFGPDGQPIGGPPQPEGQQPPPQQPPPGMGAGGPQEAMQMAQQLRGG